MQHSFAFHKASFQHNFNCSCFQPCIGTWLPPHHKCNTRPHTSSTFRLRQSLHQTCTWSTGIHQTMEYNCTKTSLILKTQNAISRHILWSKHGVTTFSVLLYQYIYRGRACMSRHRSNWTPPEKPALAMHNSQTRFDCNCVRTALDRIFSCQPPQ